jgi:hypothetical protein
VCLLALATITSGGRAMQPGNDVTPAATATPAPQPAAPNRSAQLAALDPRNPWGYFLLGEMIAAEASDAQSKQVARTLFVLAYETSKKAGADALKSGDAPAGADIRISVALALASIADSDSERRWLHAIASSLGWNNPDGPGPIGTAQSAPIDPAGLDLASAIGLIRIAEGRRAAKLLEKPEVAATLDRSERLLSPAGLTGGASRIRRLMAEWPICAECKNRRFIKSAQGVRLCPTCGGKPGPKITQQELLYQLRLESSLLHGVQRSWVAQTIVDGGEPLRDLDPDELAATYRVDPARTVWRGGAWVTSAGAASTAAPAAPPESGR